MKNLRYSRGFSLLEVMVAVGVLSVATYAIISMVRGGTLGQKTLQAQDDARTLVSDLSTTLANTAACTNTFGSGALADGGTLLAKYSPALANPATGASITTVFDGASNQAFTVGQPYGNRGVILNGITIGGVGTDAKTKLQKWTPATATTGLAFVQVDWLQSGGAANTSGPQHLYRFFTVSVTKMNGTGQILSCSAQAGSASMGTGQPNYLSVWLTASTIGSSNLYQDSSGNIGIGTITPASNVDIFGANTGASQSNAGGMILRVQDGLNVPAAAVYGNIDGTALADNTASALAVREVSGTGRSITTSGSVAIGGNNGTVSSYVMGTLGVGTNSPSNSYNLQVGNATGSGTVASGAFYYLSDRSLKKDIEPLASRGSVLDRLENLNGVYFRWKETDQASIGLIAQDVAKDFPELVDMREQGHWHVQYGNIIAIAIEAIKELKTKFMVITSNHEDRIAIMEQQIAALKQDNLELKKQIGALLRDSQKK